MGFGSITFLLISWCWSEKILSNILCGGMHKL